MKTIELYCDIEITTYWYYGVSIKSFWIHLCLYIYTIFPPMSEPSHSYIISINIENVKFVVLSLISWWYLQMDQFSISYIVLDIANLNFVFYIHSFLLFSTSYQYFFILWNVTIFTEIPCDWILIFHITFYVLLYILFIHCIMVESLSESSIMTIIRNCLCLRIVYM